MTTKTRRTMLAAPMLTMVLGLTALATPTAAQSDYPFRLHNRSEGWTISGFQTFQGGQWSSNWLDGPIRAGQFANMDWKSNAGNCTVRFRVSWVDYGATEHQADFCKLKNVYMLNEGFRLD
jgi:hypothetical protein